MVYPIIILKSPSINFSFIIFIFDITNMTTMAIINLTITSLYKNISLNIISNKFLLFILEFILPKVSIKINNIGINIINRDTSL